MNEWLDNIRTFGRVLPENRIEKVIENRIERNMLEELQNYEDDTSTSTVHQDSETDINDVWRAINDFFVPESRGNNELNGIISFQPIQQYWSQKNDDTEEKENVLPDHLFHIEE